jgi:hypothetical protein
MICTRMCSFYFMRNNWEGHFNKNKKQNTIYQTHTYYCIFYFCKINKIHEKKESENRMLYLREVIFLDQFRSNLVQIVVHNKSALF